MDGNRPISEWYVEWANTLDSAGEDSSLARGRLTKLRTIDALMKTFSKVAVAGTMAGDIKKYIYYGDEGRFERTFLERRYNDIEKEIGTIPFEDVFTRLNDHEITRLLHGILGLIDEAAELAQPLFDYIYNGTPLDRTNIIEECGDSQWYMSLIAKWLGQNTLDGIHEANFRKLVARYPDRQWKQEHALDDNRDKEAERKAIDMSSDIVHLIRTYNVNNKYVWVMVSKSDSLWGKTTDTRLSIFHKWQKRNGEKDWNIVEYERGPMPRSEAAALIADIQEGKIL